MKWSLSVLLALSLVPAAGALAQSQDEKDKVKDNPPRQQEPNKQQQPERSGPPRQEEPKKEETRKKEEPTKQEKSDKEKSKNEAGRRDRNQPQEQNGKNREERQPEQARSANPSPGGNPRHGGHRIPDSRFRASFGPQHRFHVHPEGGGAVQGGGVQGGRFQYSGYWFEFAQPWPVGWSYDDDCYVDWVDDDYYLFDEMHPGIRILIIVAG